MLSRSGMLHVVELVKKRMYPSFQDERGYEVRVLSKNKCIIQAPVNQELV